MFIFPISDENQEGHRHIHQDFVNYGLIFLCFALTCYEASLYADNPARLRAFIEHWSFKPGDYLGAGYVSLGPWERVVKLLACMGDLRNMAMVKMLSSTFLHGGFTHLIGNMLILWMLGDNLEYVMGHLRYLIFFLLTGIISGFGDTLFATYASFGPGIGASGAILAVAGAYLVYFPKANINFCYWIGMFWYGVQPVSARLVICIYFICQLAVAWYGYGTDYGKIGVWSHICGFICGVILAYPFKKGIDQAHLSYQPQARKKFIKPVSARHGSANDHWGKGS